MDLIESCEYETIEIPLIAHEIIMQTTKSPEREQILRWFELDKGIYHVGCTAKRLTFHSQQQRAFNLIWSLKEEFGLADKRVAIVGTGLAGLTAAAAAHLLKAKVELFEKKADNLPLQRGNATRFVHPNIYSWPKPGSVYPVTHLPYFNWYDAEAGEIARKVLEQWNEISEEIPQKYLKTITKVSSKNGKVFLDFEDGSSEPPYDFTLIAAGFGLEKALSETSTPSYWRNDSLDQPVLEKKPVLTYCVCGAGDGALLDTIRLKIKDFQHRQLVDWMLRNPWFFSQAEHISDALSNGKSIHDVWLEFGC
ncbi:MAG: FAD-dependent oxidoreductase [Candidatus Obscuribacter sp.]|nr:FAD-dependent oxidoreductase [Candidatus Obscuribacter sp.]